jgi:fructose-1,6-bisphosphatase I
MAIPYTKRPTSLNEFIIERQHEYPDASGELSALLNHIALAAKLVNRAVNKAGLIDILGSIGSSNASGEEVKKMDMFAHNHFLQTLTTCGQCCGVASEESDDIIILEDEISKHSKYVVCIDPLDGSSNIDVNVSVGTIFAIYTRLSPENGACNVADFLQPGRNLVAAGYVIYGSSTVLMYSTGNGVNGFTLDPSIGEFCLSNPNVKTPENGLYYSINESYKNYFPTTVNEFIEYCKADDKATKRPYSSRYVGSMVADLHRNLLKGGIFMYPPMKSHPRGKLRILFECNPMAFIVEQAGGIATDGEQAILDLKPTKIHERTPIYIGSSAMVNKLLEFTQVAEPIWV